jgi:hypothetical protein
MTRITQIGQAGLKGWRTKVGDSLAGPVSRRTPLEADQVRALVGAVFFVLAVSYVVRALQTVLREARA